jgi:multiple sugar transport system permease protein
MVDSKHQWKAWIYLSPAIVLLLVFTLWPIINTVRMAFMNGYNMMGALGGRTFEYGFDNFVKVVGYKDFFQYLGTTMLLCVLTVPISTILALLIAVALNSIKILQKPLQTIFFLPYVTNSIAIGMVFFAMFNRVGTGNLVATQGIINNVIEFFGGTAQNWINVGSDYGHNIFVLVVYIVWNALPFKILVLLGGLQSINKQYYDAAKVDGTSRDRVLRKITVPLLSPMIAYVVITSFISGFKEYSSVVGIFGVNMGPADDKARLNTIVGYIYDSLSGKHQGRASAAALILFGIIFIVTMINLRVSKKKVHY